MSATAGRQALARPPGLWDRARLALVLLALALAPAAWAQESELRLSIARAGGGFLVADGGQVPLFVVVSADQLTPVKSAKIGARAGKVSEVKVLAPDRVRFLYQTPRKGGEVQESLDVTLIFANGERTESFPFKLGGAAPPGLDLVLEPEVLAARDKDRQRVDLVAAASGAELEGLQVAIGPGTTAPAKPSPTEGGLKLVTTVDVREVPDDQPALLLAVAVASARRSFAVKTRGLATEAPIRLSVELPPGAELVVDGASNDPPPVRAPADGRTVMENVLVRYDAPITAYGRQGGKKQEVAVAMPSTSAAGVVLAIPGQAVSDGGTGPTLVVTVPPAPFAGELYWPEIQVEGATLVGVQKISADVRALILKRPTEVGVIRVLLDEQPAGSVELLGGYGVLVEASAAYVKSGERAAVEVVVRDALGEPTDVPEPRVRVAGGEALAPVRDGVGRYRASVPSGKGGEGALKIVAEIPAPHVISGEPLELGHAEVETKLTGASPAVAEAPPPPPPPPPKEEVEIDTDYRRPREPLKLGAGLVATAGTTFSGLLVVGGGVLAELRLPLLDNRLAVRTGLLFSHASGAGTVRVGEQDSAGRATFAGLVIPLDVGFAVLKVAGFELLARAGAALRLEDGALVVGGDTLAGGKRAALGGHVSLEGDIEAGGGAIVLGASLDGIGASVSGFSDGERELRGPLTNVRVDAGYRLWF